MPDRRLFVRTFTRRTRQRITIWTAAGDCIVVEGGHTAGGKPCVLVDLPTDLLFAAEPIRIDSGDDGGE